MMSPEASVDKRVLSSLRIKHRELAVRPLYREDLGRGMIGTLLAKPPVAAVPKPPTQPNPPLRVDHAVVVVSLGIPDLLRAPIRRRLHELVARRMARPERFRCVCIAHRSHKVRGRMLDWIEDRDHVGTVLG